MEYWNILDDLTQKESMNRLNKARVGFKHYGIRVSKVELMPFGAGVQEFFLTSTQTVFGVDFEQVSLVDVLPDSDVKNLLREAIDCAGGNKYEGALQKVALGFRQILKSYEETKIDIWQRSKFDFLESTRLVSRSRLRPNTHNPFEKKLHNFAKEVEKALKRIQEVIKIMGFGIDLREYVRFQSLVPLVFETINGKTHFGDNRIAIPQRKDIDFTIDFCIQTALQLAASDYSLLRDRTIEEGMGQIIRIVADLAKKGPGELIKIKNANWKNIPPDAYELNILIDDTFHGVRFTEYELTIPEDEKDRLQWTSNNTLKLQKLFDDLREKNNTTGS